MEAANELMELPEAPSCIRLFVVIITVGIIISAAMVNSFMCSSDRICIRDHLFVDLRVFGPSSLLVGVMAVFVGMFTHTLDEGKPLALLVISVKV